MPEAHHWDAMWQDKDTPWDLGGVTPALVQWARHVDLRGSRVLVPGCGRGYDAHFLAKQGAEVVAVDISEKALAAARATHPDSRVIWRQGDVTALEEKGRFDYAWEHTCLCALDRDMLDAYLRSVSRSLAPSGRYFGLTFHTVRNPENGPPFQIAPSALRDLLEGELNLENLEEDTDRSIKPRLGSEMWFEAGKRG